MVVTFLVYGGLKHKERVHVYCSRITMKSRRKLDWLKKFTAVIANFVSGSPCTCYWIAIALNLCSGVYAAAHGKEPCHRSVITGTQKFRVVSKPEAVYFDYGIWTPGLACSGQWFALFLVKNIWFSSHFQGLPWLALPVGSEPFCDVQRHFLWGCARQIWKPWEQLRYSVHVISAFTFPSGKRISNMKDRVFLWCIDTNAIHWMASHSSVAVSGKIPWLGICNDTIPCLVQG
jgi:hypothetical protein